MGSAAGDRHRAYSVSLGTTGDRVPLESPCPAPHTRPRSTQAPFAALHAHGSSPQAWTRTRTHAPAHSSRRTVWRRHSLFSPADASWLIFWVTVGVSQFHVVFTTDKLVSAGSKRLLTEHTFLGHVSPGKDVGITLRACGLLHLGLPPVHRLPPSPGRKGRPQAPSGRLGQRDGAAPMPWDAPLQRHQQGPSPPRGHVRQALPAGECVHTDACVPASLTHADADRQKSGRERQILGNEAYWKKDIRKKVRRERQEKNI